MTRTVTTLPVGPAADIYRELRRRGRSVEYALGCAAKVAACPDDYACAKCGAALDTSKHVRIRAGRAWCVECALQPTGHEQKENR